jgi:hypothetical protein
MKRLLAILVPCLIGVSLVAVPCFAKAESPQTDGALLAGIPNPPNSKSLGAGLKRAEIFVDQRRGSGRDDLREYLHVAIEAE